MYLTHMDLVALAKQPVAAMEGLEVHCVRPDPSLIASFPNLTRSTISRWQRPEYFFFLSLLGGQPVGYRCLATVAAPSLRRFLRLRPHQLFTVDVFTRPDLRRRGLTRPLKIVAARHVVQRGYREIWSVERTTNYDTVVSAERTGTVRVGTLVRTSFLGRAQFAVTPATIMSPALVARQMDLLKRLAPTITRVGILHNPSLTRLRPNTQESMRILAADRGVDLLFFEVREVVDQAASLERVFASMAEAAVQGLIVHSDPMLRRHASTVVALARRHRLAAVFDARPFVAAGGLVAYGTTPLRLVDFGAVMAHFATQQSASADQADLPADLELTVNCDEAAALGITTFPATPSPTASGSLAASARDR
jgi:putative ABC transport system substrate-binding protein